MTTQAQDQIQLFDDVPAFPPYARGSKTSRDAAAAQVPKLGKLQRAYVDALRQHGGLTDHDAAAILRRPLSSINARRNECMALGLVEASARTKMSPFGKQATVWIAGNTGSAGQIRTHG
jgi:hypothetical protein